MLASADRGPSRNEDLASPARLWPRTRSVPDPPSSCVALTETMRLWVTQSSRYPQLSARGYRGCPPRARDLRRARDTAFRPGAPEWTCRRYAARPKRRRAPQRGDFEPMLLRPNQVGGRGLRGLAVGGW